MKKFIITEEEKKHIKSLYEQVSGNKKSKTIVHGGDPNKLREELKKMGEICWPKVYGGSQENEVVVEYTEKESGNQLYGLSYIFSDRGEERLVLDKVGKSNDIDKSIPYNFEKIKGYIIFIKLHKTINFEEGKTYKYQFINKTTKKPVNTPTVKLEDSGSEKEIPSTGTIMVETIHSGADVAVKGPNLFIDLQSSKEIGEPTIFDHPDFRKYDLLVKLYK